MEEIQANGADVVSNPLEDTRYEDGQVTVGACRKRGLYFLSVTSAVANAIESVEESAGPRRVIVLPMIDTQRPRIEALCRRRAVRRLEIFGSAARDDFDEATSDLDFLVEFEPDTSLPALDRYFGLKEDLEGLFGRPVDLVMPGAVANPYVRAEIERDRRLIYAA